MLIGLCGYKGVGKNEVGKYLVQEYDFTRIAFADKLKEGVAALFGITVDEINEMKNEEGARVTIEAGWFDSSDRSPDYAPVPSFIKSMSMREILQRFGTEVGREIFGENFWVDQLFWNGQPPEEWGSFVITDCRFQQEAHRIHEYGGVVIKIDRPGYESDGHASEIIDFQIDGTILNTGTIEDLHKAVDSMIQRYRSPVTNDTNGRGSS